MEVIEDGDVEAWVSAEVEAAARAAWIGATPPIDAAAVTVVARALPPHGAHAADGAHGAQIVGVVKMSTTLDGMYVDRIVVRKDWRRTRGVGRALLGRVVEEARARAGATVVHLATFDFQGLAYYPRVGFTKDADLPGWSDGIAAAFFSLPSDSPAADAAVAAAAAPGPFVLETLTDEDADVEQFASDEIAAQELEAIGHDDGFFAVSYAALTPGGPNGSERVGAATAVGFWGGLIITGVAVVPHARRTGVGRALVERLLAAGRERGCLLATIDVLNVTGTAFWERLGFVEFGQVGSTASVKRIKMVRRLTAG